KDADTPDQLAKLPVGDALTAVLVDAPLDDLQVSDQLGRVTVATRDFALGLTKLLVNQAENLSIWLGWISTNDALTDVAEQLGARRDGVEKLRRHANASHRRTQD